MIKAKSNFISPYFDILCDDGYGDFNDDGDEVDRTEQIFNFVDVPLFVSVVTQMSHFI